ncbi:extracellular solute-binding protein family 3 [Arthrobacter crystallopoietes BAB-32]|uniref:Extracellular solute-binding protein family 3 n=1 Tax=Arthrobacter crystallopoietes BAB-32 TaxID=1246476 RepID=N1V1Y7_9MICC|nr:ABC transporter substrate-binding protein [Arthrobacter crystallopoietes]EMY34014.1 extracellular solute-binding protein family 3 [Arthrobacter crystallopoietes BAB-32]
MRHFRHRAARPPVLAGSVLLALSLAACTNASQATPDASAPAAAAPGTEGAGTVVVNEKAQELLPEEIKAAGVLRVASDPTYAPFEYYDTDNKTMIGYDVDFSDAVGAALGLKIEHVPATFDTILPGLASGKYDMAMSTFSITPEREKIVDFVDYLKGGSGVAVVPGNPQNITMDPLSMCGKKIAGQKGSIQSMEYLPEFSKQCTEAGQEPISIQNFPGQSDANLALTSGRVDAVVADSVSLAYQGKEAGGKFELAEGEDYEPVPTGIALGKDAGLQEAVTEATRGILDSPYYAEMADKWGLPDSVLITSDVLDQK